MSDLNEPFTLLLGRQPTDKERQKLYRVRDALNIKSTDALWLLLMAFQYHQTLYEAVPARIAEAARDATSSARGAAEAQAKAAHAETKKALMDAVREVAVVSAKQAAGAERSKWLSAAVIVVTVTMAALGWWQHRQGEAKGVAIGQNTALRACAYAALAASWANTPDGRRAYEIDKAGGLHDLVNCTGRDLERKADWCLVETDRGKAIYRWRLSAE